MRVLIADKFEKSGLDKLQAIGCDVVYRPGAKEEALVREVEQGRPDVLIVRSTKVSEAVLNAGALKLVVRAGAGYNTIDVAAASRRGIYVSNCPGKNSVAVAELAFGLILSLDRRIPDNVIALRQGQWDKAEYLESAGAVRADAGADRGGTDRAGDDSAGGGIRHAGGGVEPEPDAGRRRTNWEWRTRARRWRLRRRRIS